MNLGEVPALSSRLPSLLARVQDFSSERIAASISSRGPASHLPRRTSPLWGGWSSRAKFREDLLLPASTWLARSSCPPLRSRQEDIPLLAAPLLRAKHARNRRRRQIDLPQAMEILLNYPWPGETS